MFQEGHLEKVIYKHTSVLGHIFMGGHRALKLTLKHKVFYKNYPKSILWHSYPDIQQTSTYTLTWEEEERPKRCHVD